MMCNSIRADRRTVLQSGSLLAMEAKLMCNSMVRGNARWLAVCGLALLSACAESPTKSVIEFEPAARAILPDVEGSAHPKLLVGPSGALTLLTVVSSPSGRRLGLTMSDNGGDGFSPLVPISEEGSGVSAHGENSPSLVATPTEIYALWERFRADGPTELRLSRSLSFGHSFEPSIAVTDKTAPSFNGFSSLAASAAGKVYAVWLDGRDAPDPPGTFSIMLARSEDRGASVQPNVKIDAGACPCCRPAIALGQPDEVYVAWRKVFPDNIRDMVVARSTDGGKTFQSEPTRVAEDGWKIDGCPDSGPVLARVNERLYIAWFTEGSQRGEGIWLAFSEDGSKSFSKPVLASAGILDVNHPAFSASHDGRLWLIFQGRSQAAGEAWQTIQPFVAEIRSDGVTPAVAAARPKQSVSYPRLAAGLSGRLFVTWAESSDSGSSVVLVRGRTTPDSGG